MKQMISIYKKLLSELNEEISEGVLEQKDKIQVLRAKTPVFQDYCPITEWYYDAFTMEEELGESLEAWYMKEEFTEEEWGEMICDQIEYKTQYRKDQPDLVEVPVKDVLTEIKQMLKLFKS